MNISFQGLDYRTTERSRTEQRLTVDGHPDGVLDGAAADVGVLGAARHRPPVVARPRTEVHPRHRQRLPARRTGKLKWRWDIKDSSVADCPPRLDASCPQSGLNQPNRTSRVRSREIIRGSKGHLGIWLPRQCRPSTTGGFEQKQQKMIFIRSGTKSLSSS